MLPLYAVSEKQGLVPARLSMSELIHSDTAFIPGRLEQQLGISVCAIIFI